MSDGGTHDDERTISAFAPGSDPDDVAEAVVDAGGVVATDPEDVAGTDAVLAVGDRALSALAAVGVSTPVLPVGTALETAPESVSAAVECALAGTYEICERPVVRAETPERAGHAVFDVSLTAAEPGMISAFTIEMDGERARSPTVDDRVARFRADGVVVATPAGSRGYARAATGPVVLAGSDVVTVVPIAPFATDPDHWVLPLSAVAITVEREMDVAVTVDGRPHATVSPGTTVRLARAGALRVAVPSATGTGKWETF